MSRSTCLTLAFAASFAAGAADAGTLDFTEVAPGAQGGPVLALSNATLTSDGADAIVFAPDASGFPGTRGYCAVDAVTCTADFTVAFASGVENLTFEVRGFDPGDNAVVSAFDGRVRMQSLRIDADGLYDLISAGPVDNLIFEDASDPSARAGFRYGAFSFDAVAVPPIPLPAPAFLLLGGLAACAALRTRAARA